MSTEMFEISVHCIWNDDCTWFWNIGKGLGFMGSASIGHYKDSHRNWRSDWLVVERRNCHYQMVLEKRPKRASTFKPKCHEEYASWMQADFRQHFILFKQKQKTMQIIHFAYIPDGKGPCQSLPQLARNYHLQIDQILFYPYQFLRYSLLQQRKTPSSQ